MQDFSPTILSAVDYARLQGLMCTMIGSQTALASLLRRKLDAVVIMRPDDAGPDVVTSGRSVRFRVNDRDRDERKLTWLAAGANVDPALLSLREVRGLALLGLSAGQSIAYGTGDGQGEFLTVELVLSDEDLPELPVPREQSALLARP